MKKRILALGLSVIMAMAMIAGCASEKTEGDGEKLQFEIMVKSFQSSYWQAAVTGVKNACEEFGVEANCDGPNMESDIADQVKMLEAAIEKQPDGIGLAACDAKAVIEALGTALEKKIPVVCFDAGVPDAPAGSVYATIATDNKAAGAVAATNMFPVIKDKIVAATAAAPVRIGEVNQDATGANIIDRGLGFIDKMIELCKAENKKVAVIGNEAYVNGCSDKGDAATAEVIIEVAVPAQTDVATSATEAQKIMAKADTIAIFGSNEVTANGVIVADESLNKLNADPAKGIVAAGFDAGTKQKDAIRADKFVGSVTQSPLMMGYECIKALVEINEGKEVKDIPMDGYWYDKKNMEDADIAPNLYD